MSTSPLPTAPFRLGLLATVPFVAGALGVWIVDATMHPDAHRALAQALSAYAAVVVSFIGAIHWGLAFTSHRPKTSSFVWGVVPSLAGWAGVVVAPHAGLLLHAVTLVACYGVDRRTYPEAGVAAWLPLRLRLTVVATISCLLGAAGAWPA